MSVQRVPIERVRLNDHNPRLIKDERFQQLVKSIQEFPQMLELRPLVVDEEYRVLGGNMRLHALMHLQVAEVPIMVATGLTEAQKQEFVIKDNASFGEWDWDQLANEWADLPLGNWGLDLPTHWLEQPEDATDHGSGEGGGEGDEEQEARPITMTITFTAPEHLQQAETDVQELIDRKWPGATYAVQVGMRHG